MASIVVTGGAGFLGSNLVNQLVREHMDVCATFNYTPHLKTNLANQKYLRWFHCDVTDFNQVGKLIMQEDPEVVYHLVAQPIVTAAKRNPLLTFELTTRGTWNVLEAIRLYSGHIKAVVFVSSDKVYGSNTNAIEEDPLNGTDHPYNVAKVSADVISQSYIKAYGLPIAISRSANLYGPGDFHWDRVVPGISRDLYYGRQPVVRSSGQLLRDYIHVQDGVRGLRLMADAMVAGRILPGSIFNFGSKEMYTVLDVVNFLRMASGRMDLQPEILGRATDEIDAQHINYEHAAHVLGWIPAISMETGIRETYSWYRSWFEQ